MQIHDNAPGDAARQQLETAADLREAHPMGDELVEADAPLEIADLPVVIGKGEFSLDADLYFALRRGKRPCRRDSAEPTVLSIVRSNVSRRCPGELSCDLNFIAKAGIIFFVKNIVSPIGGTMTRRFAIAEA